MSAMEQLIEKNILEIKEKIWNACEKVGRSSDEVMLVAATKTRTVEEIQLAIRAGISACGENRVNELSHNLQNGAYLDCPVHFIGHLQTNKLKQVVGKVELIESIDSIHLAEAVSEQAVKLGICQDVLLEVNIGSEGSKYGFEASELYDVIEKLSVLKGIRINGLMCIPPAVENAHESSLFFEKMFKLFIDISNKKYDNVYMRYLSQGMSHDFEQAIYEGANIVRIGTGIFGPRSYSRN